MNYVSGAKRREVDALPVVRRSRGTGSRRRRGRAVPTPAARRAPIASRAGPAVPRLHAFARRG